MADPPLAGAEIFDILMIKASVGFSQNLDNHRLAAAEAAQSAVNGLDGKEPDILFVFSSVKYNQEDVLAGVRSIVPHAPVVGASAAGEITSWTVAYDAVNVMAVSTEQIKFAIGCGEGVSKDSFKAGAAAAASVIKNNGGKMPDLFVMIPDGLTGNGAAIVEGAKSVLGINFPIIGGSAGDDYRFEKTYEYCEDKVLSDAVVGVGFSGDFSFGFGVRHGWEPVGLQLMVTKADGVVIKEIDNQPALKVYEDYFGKNASDLIKEPLARMAYTYPFGIVVPGSDELLIRHPIVANEKGEITMTAPIPEGTLIRLMIGDRDSAIKAAKFAALTARKQLGGRPARFVIMFNCVVRNKLLGARCNDENKEARAALGVDIPMIGFYTYGEQAPLRGIKGTPAYFHNETMTMLVVGE